MASAFLTPLNVMLCPTLGTKSLPGPSNLEHEPNLSLTCCPSSQSTSIYLLLMALILPFLTARASTVGAHWKSLSNPYD